MKNTITIDPGASGGIAWIDNDGVVCAKKMPEGMTAQLDFLRSLSVELKDIDICLIEKVGFHQKGNNASASTKFGRHCGHLEAGLYLTGIPFEEVTPAKWSKHLGSLPKSSEKTARKNAIKELMQRKYPHRKVTLATADALGILSYYEHRRMRD